MTLTFILLTNGAWLTNYASNGPVLGIFVVLIIFFTFIWDRKIMLFVNGFILLNIIVLFIFELNNSDFIPKYESPDIRLFDIYIGTIFYVIIVAFFGSYAKTNYLKKYNEARESEDLKNKFLQNISHDIKTPINSILGFTQLLKDPLVSDNKRELAIKYIESSGHYLNSIINDLLEVLIIENNKTNVTNTRFDLNELLVQLHNELKVTIPPMQKVDLVNDSEKEQHEFMIISDRVKLKRIIINLINNAIKYTKTGSIHFGYQMNDPFTIQFHVKDSGKGISMTDQSIIFERFQQIDDGNLSSNSGIGLGLAICKSYSAMLGGNIWVESIQGTGSNFFFTIKNDKIEQAI
ncbi:MAG: sensor histidine kinase [Prolixibacteraceae bacterium]